MAPHNQVHLNVLQRGANDADSASHVGSDVLSGLSLEDTEATSQGVIMMEGVARILTKLRRRGIFLSLFILSTAYGFDNVVRSAYQPKATDYFKAHSALATINVLRTVFQAAVYPIMASLANKLGRLETVFLGIVFYALGTTIEATARNIEAFAVGGVLYQVGFTTLLLLVVLIVGDITKLKSRLFWSTVPIWHALFDTWLSGRISQNVLDKHDWRVGYGMWAAIVPVASIPLIWLLLAAYIKALSDQEAIDWKWPWQLRGSARLRKPQFWKNLAGNSLIIPGLACFLVALTIAGGGDDTAEREDRWSTAGVLVPLIIGLLCIIAWIIWQWAQGSDALVPFDLLRDRAIWAAFGIACMVNFCWTMQGDFLYTVLIVAFDSSVGAATTITALYSFCSVLTVTVLGHVVRRVKAIRTLKPFILTGVAIFTVAFGLLLHFRGGLRRRSGVIAAQIFLGIGGGFITYPVQTSMQGATPHENLAIVQGMFMASFSIGSALGNAVSGAIWSQTLVPTLLRTLPTPFKTNTTLAVDIYRAPFKYADVYPIGDPLRDGIVESYKHVQMLLTASGLGLCLLLIMLAIVLRSPVLGNEQSPPEAELRTDHGSGGKLRKWLGHITTFKSANRHHE